MLVVVEDGDVHLLAELRLDVEAVRGLDVLEVDAAEGGFERLHHPHHLFGVGDVQLDVEDVNVGEPLEEDALPLHHRLGGEGADVAEAEHGGPVRDHRHQVPARGVVEGPPRILVDFPAGLGDPGTVGERQVALGLGGFRGPDLDLSGPAGQVVVEGILSANQGFLLTR